MKNLNLLSVANAINGEIHFNSCDYDKEISGAVIDSRLVRENFLFFAVKGAKVDGHNFIDDVYEKGALAVVSEKILDTEKPYILVESSLEALKLLAKFYRQQLNIPIIGISGSVGKTSTKEFVANVLSTKYKVLKTEGNFNNEIGLPLTILKIREEHEVAVIEMGISDFGEMTRLAEIAVPDICILTNIGICHLENLKDRDGVLKAKTEMFARAKMDCKVILNGDDDKLATVKEVNGRKVIFYGLDKSFNCFGDNIINHGIDGSACNIHINDEMISVNIKIPGIHMIYNALAAAVAGSMLGLSKEDIKHGIEEMTDAAGRVNIIRRKYTIIDDCYNANPVSMKASIDLLNTATGRKIAVIGDMLELGVKENELHYEIGEYIAKTDIDYVFVSGNLSKNIIKGYEFIKSKKDNVFWFENNYDLIYNLKQFVEKGDTILVKSSHSMHFEKIVEALV